MDTYLPGATIKVREIPELEATTDANGDYELEVPDDTNVTPYIDPPARLPPDRPADVPHARRADRERQLPDAGRRRVRRASRRSCSRAARTRRSPDTVRDRHHRLGPRTCAASTTRPSRSGPRTASPARRSSEFPALAGPDLLQRERDPGPSKTETSDDGGIVWTEVPAGAYRIITRARRPVRQLPRHLRARPDRQREPAVGSVRAERRRGAAGREHRRGIGYRRRKRLRRRRPPDRGNRRRRRGHANQRRAPQGRKARRPRAPRSRCRDQEGQGADPPVAAGKGKGTLTVKLRDAAGDAVTTDHAVEIPAP